MTNPNEDTMDLAEDGKIKLNPQKPKLTLKERDSIVKE
jgi:hypothetical protein